MKQRDIATLVIIAAVSLVASYFIMNAIFSQNKGASVEVKVVEVIKSDVGEPSPAVFSETAINPAVQVFIGVEGETAANGDTNQ